jgi:hypothetical protein
VHHAPNASFAIANRQAKPISVQIDAMAMINANFKPS